VLLICDKLISETAVLGRVAELEVFGWSRVPKN